MRSRNSPPSRRKKRCLSARSAPPATNFALPNPGFVCARVIVLGVFPTVIVHAGEWLSPGMPKTEGRARCSPSLKEGPTLAVGCFCRWSSQFSWLCMCVFLHAATVAFCARYVLRLVGASCQFVLTPRFALVRRSTQAAKPQSQPWSPAQQPQPRRTPKQKSSPLPAKTSKPKAKPKAKPKSQSSFCWWTTPDGCRHVVRRE